MVDNVVEQHEWPFSVSPNPASDFLYFSMDGEEVVLTNIQLYDIYGKEVIHTVFEDRISIRSLPAGLYYIVIGDREGKRYVGKVMKMG